MASPGPSFPPPAASNSTGALPPDLLFDVLLRLPAKFLFCHRAVCRSLRSFTSDPLFVAEHTARHPLLVANFRNDEVHIRVFDLLGNVVKP